MRAGRPCDTLVTDHSIASATGLWTSTTWSGTRGFDIAGITAQQLADWSRPPPVCPGTSWPPPRSACRSRTPLMLGAGDGPLANLGLGAVHPGMAACSIGTSGAIRVMVERPGVDPSGGSVLLRAHRGRWTVGGAINNGGIVLNGQARRRTRAGPDALRG